MKLFIDKVLIKILFFILFIISFGYIYTPNSYKWYRKFKGGIWFEYYEPIKFPYGSFWTQDEVSETAVIFTTEDYNKKNENILDD